MTLSPSRIVPGRFVRAAALALLVTAATGGVASAQDAGGETKAGGGLVLFMIESLGWVFGPLLLAISVGMVALIVLLFLDLRMSSEIGRAHV